MKVKSTGKLNWAAKLVEAPEHHFAIVVYKNGEGGVPDVGSLPYGSKILAVNASEKAKEDLSFFHKYAHGIEIEYYDSVNHQEVQKAYTDYAEIFAAYNAAEETYGDPNDYIGSGDVDDYHRQYSGRW